MKATFDSHSEEFRRKFLKAAEEMPGTAEKYLKRSGNKMKKMVKEEIKSQGLDSGKSHKNKLTSFSSKVVGFSGLNLVYQLIGKAKHFGLIERGHTIVTPGGRTVGFKQGYHFLDKAVKRFVASGEIEKNLKNCWKNFQRILGG